ncbi:hypothetical protein B0A55_08575 [Friedmanniomyces simplex]|uniref:Major facilitator superfamily (MFS) profile domain-containing protein n=1 Tax=Friedmanniomyces simplex TaxID=329884 RepID=A0A4U0WYZ8_9PEZI|nr:hypothetical protein B0A55_08575 [Friedmanniomyces simplex]
MPLDERDIQIAKAQYDADPERWRDYEATEGLRHDYYQMHPRDELVGGQTPSDQAIEEAEPIEEAEQSAPTHRHESIASSTMSASSVSRESIRGDAQPRTRRLASVATVSDPVVEDKIINYLDRHPTAIQRIADHRLQHSLTVGSRRTGTSVHLPNFGGGKPYPPLLPEREEYVVEFDGHSDPSHAQNWPLKTKIIIACILIWDAMAATFASSIFNIAVAVSKDFQTLMISRFFCGLFGSSPLTIVAAVFSDMFSNEVRGIAVAIFSATIFCGPFMGPFVGGFIANSYLGWRWTAYIPAIMGFTACILAFFFQKESYGPVILVEKAANLRRLTRNWGIHAKQDEVEVDLGELLKKNLSRPIRILFTEPIILLVTIYLSFIYGLLYLNLTAYGLVFGQVYGWAPGVSGLPYFGLIIGVFIGFLSILAMQPGYVRKLKANNNIPVPEWRLPLTMVGGIIFVAGLFWFGWGGYKASTPWIVPTLAGLFLGFGIYTVFLCCLNYIIGHRSKHHHALYIWGSLPTRTYFPFADQTGTFAYYMFEGIGIEWGMTFLGCLATLFIPMPFVFYFYGKKIRAKSKFAPAPDIQQEKRRDEEARMGGDVGGEGESPVNGGQAAASGSSEGEDPEKGRREEV